jgi:putative phosphoesterase
VLSTGGSTSPDMKITIGVLSDTHLHGVTEAFKELYSRFLVDVDVILHAGDFTSEDIVAFLQKKPFHGVHGNMDPIEIKGQLPIKKVIEFGTYRVGLIHGAGSKSGLEERVVGEFQNVDVIVFGHSHRPENRREDGLVLFNPGTAAGYASSGHHTLGILTLDDDIHGEIIRL